MTTHRNNIALGLGLLALCVPAMVNADPEPPCELATIIDVGPSDLSKIPKNGRLTVFADVCNTPPNFRIEDAEGQDIDLEERQHDRTTELVPLTELAPGAYTLHFEQDGVALRDPQTFEVVDVVAQPVTQTPQVDVFSDELYATPDSIGLDGVIRVSSTDPEVLMMHVRIPNAEFTFDRINFWRGDSRNYFALVEVPNGEPFCVEVQALNMAGEPGPTGTKCLSDEDISTARNSRNTGAGGDEGCSTIQSPHRPGLTPWMLMLVVGLLFHNRRRTAKA